MKKFLFPLVLAALLAGCDVIDYHPYDTRVKGVHGLNAENVAQIEKNCAGRDMVKFAVISDTQRWRDAEVYNQTRHSGEIEYALCCTTRFQGHHDTSTAEELA